MILNSISLFVLLLGLICPFSSHYIFDYKSHMFPHPQKAHRGGEDAFFQSKKMLVVADGVGGWNSYGIDPSKYSRFLCQRAGELLGEDERLYVTQPLKVIEKTQAENENVGSSTMIVATLDEKNLKFCYLGGKRGVITDSGIMVIREFQEILSIYEFVEQQHSFNFPYQLAYRNGDSPSYSVCMTMQVQEGDIIIVGSDGLFDNFTFYELLQAVKKAINDGTLLTGFSEMLARTAIDRGMDTEFNSPFAKRAKQQGLQYMGGKLDDTTVIVARIKAQSIDIEQL